MIGGDQKGEQSGGSSVADSEGQGPEKLFVTTSIVSNKIFFLPVPVKVSNLSSRCFNLSRR